MMKKLLVPFFTLVLFGAGCATSTPATSTQTSEPAAVAPAPAAENTPTAAPVQAEQSAKTNSIEGTVKVNVTSPVTTPAEPKSSAKAPTPTPAPVTTLAAKTVNVTIQNFAFSPNTISVKQGDKIVFTNQDSVGHTATHDGARFDTGILNKGQSFTLDTSSLGLGAYSYRCTPHPFMTATLVIEK